MKPIGLAAIGLGLGLVAFDVAREPAPRLGADEAALVDGRPIARAELAAARAAAAGERRDGAAGLSGHLLDRLIDEELLVAHAEALGLHRRDPQLRALLGQAALELVRARAAGEPPPSERELRAAWAATPWRWATGARARVAVRRLDGAAAPAVPDAELPLSSLRTLLGGPATEAIAALPDGAAAPFVAGGLELTVLDKKSGAPRPFEEVRAEVAAEVLRQRGDQRLREFLAGLRARATIRVAADLK